MRLARSAAAALAALSLLVPATAQAAGPMRTVTYEADDSDFPNPERGFSQPDGSPAAARAKGMTLIHLYFRLDEFKTRPISEAGLAKIRARFDEVRAAGLKGVPRFIYNFPKGLPLAPGDEDAALPVVLGHIDQLAPVLKENADIIATLEAGFVGAWGEWHHSTNGLDEVEAKGAILRRLLDVMPPTRFVTLRYHRDKIAIFGRDRPLAPAEAFTSQPFARVGYYNDCFLASKDDWDTYKLSGPRSLEAQRAFIAAETRFVPQGGETCNDAADAQPYIQCPNALRDLALHHWSQLNSGYHRGVLDLWRAQGCMEEVSRRLGYRLRLTSAALPVSAQAGDAIAGEIRLVNEGFASPYNPRPVELVLRRQGGGPEHVVRLPTDPRRWAAGEAQVLRVAARLPRNLPPGDYAVAMRLPDPEPRLRARPEYAIRLANKGLWNASLGENALGLSIRVGR